jgi:hypothetical protein
LEEYGILMESHCLEKIEVLREKPPQWHFFDNKSNKVCPGIEPRHPEADTDN